MPKTLIHNRNLIKLPLAVFLVAFFIAGCPEEEKAKSMDNSQESAIEAKKSQDKPGNQDYEQATFAAGCFWGIQAAFDKVPGVKSTMVGYTGGKTENPTYMQVCSDKTGHAEAVLIEYDPNEISYKQLVDVFWQIHDPTTLNRQGPDFGTQYRSAIFYHNEEQKKAAEISKQNLQKSGKFENPIVTEIVPASAFYKAEDYHQQYFQKNQNVTCHIPEFTLKPQKVVKTEEEWKKQLTKMQYEVTRKKATEPPFSGKYDNFFEKGIYRCVVCGNVLFTSETKFDSGCGWPSFYEAASDEKIEKKTDRSHGMVRTEVICSRCGAHLGHLFKDAPQTPTSLRYCINSAALDFEEKKEEKK
jgi:peptide methionine sulfoxide reductase msrA/msrB